MADVFISYKTEEFEEANWVRQTLEHNGISCWMAPTSIGGGSNYAVEIPKAIRECRIFVLMLSEKAQESKWVPREVDQAINENKIIMPFALDNCLLKDDFNFYLSNVQRYAAYENKSAAFERMLTEIRAILGTDVPADDGQSKAPFERPSGTDTVPYVQEAEKTKSKSKTSSMSKGKLYAIIGAAAVVIIALVVVLVLVLGNKSDTGTDAEKSGDNTSAATAAVTEPEEIVMSDNLYDFTFELEGVVYKLPCKYEEFTQNGWTISSTGYTSDTKIRGDGYEYFYMSKDGHRITVYSYNAGGDARTIKECLIGGIECTLRDESNFTIAKGITANSSADEIKAAFGVPGYNSSGDDYESLTYYAVKDSSNNSVKFYCSADSEYSTITMKNYVETDDYKTVTNPDKPEYLSAYKKPTSMGDGLTSSVVKIDNALYQLPVPLGEFIDNGWTITQQSGDVPAGGTGSVTISKDDKKLELYVANLAEYQTLTENCIVYKISAYDYYNGDIMIGAEGSELSLGMERTDAEALMAADSAVFDVNEGTYSYSYSYYEYKERDFSLYIYSEKAEDGGTDKISTINISCETWNY